MINLGVNIDHTATLRNARKTYEPEPVVAAGEAELGGADSIVSHLREDRRHITDRDVRILRETVTTKLNLEMSINPDIVDIATEIKPDIATLVPEKREEITTEGGLDVAQYFEKLKKVTERLKSEGVEVSLFIDPVKEQIEKSKEVGADTIELHTGEYSIAFKNNNYKKELERIIEAAKFGKSIGLKIAAGHGLTYSNVHLIANIPEIFELNIGHTIICRAMFVGIREAVREMKSIINSVRLKV